jgi:hypothetical protein
MPISVIFLVIFPCHSGMFIKYGVLGSFLCQVICCFCSISIVHPPFSSFALLSLVLSFSSMPKVNPRSKVGCKLRRAHTAGGRGGGGAGRRCKHIVAPLHPLPGIVRSCHPDQDGVHVGIAPSRPVGSPCCGADHGTTGILQHTKGWHHHLVSIVPPPLTRTHSLP